MSKAEQHPTENPTARPNESASAKAERLLAWGAASCDAGRAFEELVDALCDANMQEADEDGTDEEYGMAAAAAALLFQIATRATNGRRWRRP